MVTALSALAVILFPVLTQRTMRNGGPASLWRTTYLEVGLIVILALILATPSAGNALTPTYGYAYIASRTLLLYGLTIGLPLISAAFAARFFGGIRVQLAAYAVGVICAAFG